MKLINAIRIIEEREKRKRKEEKERQRNGMSLKNNLDKRNSRFTLGDDPKGQKHMVNVQSIFPQEDVIALKEKTGEPHVREAISKAVHYYLKCASEE